LICFAKTQQQNQQNNNNNNHNQNTQGKQFGRLPKIAVILGREILDVGRRWSESMYRVGRSAKDPLVRMKNTKHRRCNASKVIDPPCCLTVKTEGGLEKHLLRTSFDM
jgi:hypothetical protein